MKNKIINILLVEDEEAHAELIRRAFELYPKKYLLNIVGTIKQARLILAESPPDIVIADMKLPDGNTIELLPGNIEKAQVPFIIMTSYGDEQVAVTMIKNGALDYIPKSDEMFINMPQKIERSLREWGNIKARKQAEGLLSKVNEDLYQQKALFEAIYNCIPDAIVYTDINREIIGVNPAFISIFGFTFDDLAGKKTSFFYESFEEYERQGKIRFNLTAEEHALPYEVRYRKKDGSLFPGETLGTAIKNNDGEIIGYIGIIRDISERKKDELEIESLSKFPSENPNPVFRISSNGKLLYCNQATETLLKNWDQGPLKEISENWKLIIKKIMDSEEVTVIDEIINERIFSLKIAPIQSEGYVNFYADDITEIRNAEESLRERDEDLQESQRIAHVGSWRLDISTKKVTWSKELYKMYGFDPELPPPPYSEHHKIFTPESWERLSKAWPKTVETGIPYELELETVRKDGSGSWIWVRGEVVRDVKGAITGLRGAGFDITERKLASDVLQESEEKYRLLYTAMDQGLALHKIITDETGKPVDYVFLDINDTYTKLFGVTREMSIGKRIKEVMPEVEQYWIDIYGKVALTGESSYYENYLKTTGRYYSTYAYCPKQNHFAVLVNDITERKEAENALRESEQRFKSLMEASFGGIAIHDKGLILECNHGLAVITGYSETELIGMDGLLLIAEKYRDTVMSNILAGYEKAYEAVGLRKNKEEFPLRLEARNIPYKGKNVRTVEFRDITEIKLAEEEQLKLQSQLQQSQKMDAIGQLAGGVAHDFNNMLAAIIGAAQLLQRPKQKLSMSGLELVEMILESSNRAADLTAKLLAFGRKGKITSSSINIDTIIDDTLALFNRTIDKKIEISVSKNAINSTVIGDKTALQGALLNMGINASHAMLNGGKLTIETRNITLDKKYCALSPYEISEGDYIEIEIRDTGTGIDPENIDKIFEPFFTTNELGKGTGLGLASVYGTIQNHHGAINVYSEIGKGTVFHLLLPCSNETVNIMKKDKILIHGFGKVLLVDDEELIRMTGKYLLEEMGYKVILAKNGLEAVEIFEKEFMEIELVIMDMVMPIMNGKEAFYKMKEIDSNCKVLITSGFTKDENLDKLIKAGLTGFLQKPFREYELSSLLADVLAGDK